MAIAEIDFNVDDTTQSIIAFLKRVTPLLVTADQQRVIDLSRSKYLGPDAAALVYALWLEGRLDSRPCEVRLPSEPESLAAFCEFSGLNHRLLGGVPPNPEHPESETVPVNDFKKPLANQAYPIIKLIQRHTELAKDVEEYLYICFNEVAQNIDDHSGSPIGGVSCARFMRQRNEIRVAIVDRGRGITETLRRRYNIVDARDALSRVIQGGHTSKSLETNQGLGISNMALVVKNSGGTLMIVSDDAYVESRAGQPPVVQRLGFVFKGTAVFFRLPLATVP